MGILKLDECDDELPETHITNSVANHVAHASTKGEDDDPLSPMDVLALIAEWDVVWGKSVHASSRSLALMALPPAYLKNQIWELYDLGPVTT